MHKKIKCDRCGKDEGDGFNYITCRFRSNLCLTCFRDITLSLMYQDENHKFMYEFFKKLEEYAQKD